MNDYLYKTLDTIRKYGNLNIELSNDILKNLNPKYNLRTYQKEALINFEIYMNNQEIREKPTQVLFHMATGSGKTLLMAYLILDLYQKGYRNFLFFVNSTTIINKTKDNFLDINSSKYLFNKNLNIAGKNIKINVVNNFQNCQDNDINICFSTIQGLHEQIIFVKENQLSELDFIKNKTVFISDEAHHVNALTLNNKLSTLEKEEKTSWENTINNRLLHANPENILLEFTATCDIDNEKIQAKYKNKIIYNYPLKRFREDGYSKEVETLQSNASLKTKMLIAILTSQYRLKLFQDYNIDIKPVILFKSDLVEKCENNFKLFQELIENLTEKDILNIKEDTTSEILMNMFIYYEKNNILISNLIKEIKDDFSVNKCLLITRKEKEKEYLEKINNLDSYNNQYRAIFEVKMLDEGWDVLCLFDIVRLYETRDGRMGLPGKKTIQEAQLIGRGARYCPFSISYDQDKFTRKYDNDLTNDLRICETLLYHCQLESRYISELKVALKETGIIPEENKKIEYKLKESFKQTEFYKTGLIFKNDKILKNRSTITSIPEIIKNNIHEYTFSSGITKNESIFGENIDFRNITEPLNENNYTIKEIANKNYNLVFSALRKYSIFQFSTLKQYFPNLTSIKEFIESPSYLGNINIKINTVNKIPNNEQLFKALFNLFYKLSDNILQYAIEYEGSKEFYAVKFNEIFKDKIINITNPGNDSIGISQKDVINDDYRLDLSDKDWYVYNDNYGTTEEKKFVKFFNDYVAILKEKFEQVFLIRNERELAIYSFENGERFEPDYLLVLINNNKPCQYQIFIEPKGNHLLIQDKWKEDFLLKIKENSLPVVKFVDNNQYLIWGFPFYNKENKELEFKQSIEKLLK